MRLRAKLNPEELSDVRKMVRRKMYWPRLPLANWYGLALLSILLWASIDTLVQRTKVNGRGFGIAWAIVAAIAGWAIFSTKRGMAKEFTTLHATLPDWITVGNGGLNFDGLNGATAFHLGTITRDGARAVG
jgi:hypothetical protein